MPRKCKCSKFYAHQEVYTANGKQFWDVIVDNKGNFLENVEEHDEEVSESNNPYGTFTCIKCTKEYEKLGD